MKNFKREIEGHSNVEYDFECYENTDVIEIGDAYIFFFAGIADVQRCSSDTEKNEINKNDRIKSDTVIDFVTGFWTNCYKIKTTNFDLSDI
jgi:hypothetical protein